MGRDALRYLGFLAIMAVLFVLGIFVARAFGWSDDAGSATAGAALIWSSIAIGTTIAPLIRRWWRDRRFRAATRS